MGMQTSQSYKNEMKVFKNLIYNPLEDTDLLETKSIPKVCFGSLSIVQ